MRQRERLRQRIAWEHPRIGRQQRVIEPGRLFQWRALLFDHQQRLRGLPVQRFDVVAPDLGGIGPLRLEVEDVVDGLLQPVQALGRLGIRRLGHSQARRIERAQPDQQLLRRRQVPIEQPPGGLQRLPPQAAEPFLQLVLIGKRNHVGRHGFRHRGSRSGAAQHRACSLRLRQMRQFMREQPLSGRRARCPLARAEHDVAPRRERGGINSACRRGSGRIVVDADGGQVALQRRLEVIAQSGIERVADRAERLTQPRSSR